MAQTKCPLCGEKITGGACPSCGYTLPDEDVVAAPYNYDPSDYNIEEEKYGRAPVKEEVKTAAPEIKVAGRDNEIYPAQRNTPQARQNPYANNNPAGNAQANNPYAGFNPVQNAQNRNPYANMGPAPKPIQPYANNNPPAPRPQNPYANNNPAGNVQGGNPYANFNPAGSGGASGNVKMSPSTVLTLVLGVIFSFISPAIGIFFALRLIIQYARTKDKQYLKAFKAVAIVAAISISMSIFAGVLAGLVGIFS